MLIFNSPLMVLQVTYVQYEIAAEREAVAAAEKAERKLQLRDKVSSIYFLDIFSFPIVENEISKIKNKLLCCCLTQGCGYSQLD